MDQRIKLIESSQLNQTVLFFIFLPPHPKSFLFSLLFSLLLSTHSNPIYLSTTPTNLSTHSNPPIFLPPQLISPMLIDLRTLRNRTRIQQAKISNFSPFLSFSATICSDVRFFKLLLLWASHGYQAFLLVCLVCKNKYLKFIVLFFLIKISSKLKYL